VIAFDAIAVPAGPAAYAEPFDAQSFLKMPANALVNAAYVLVALGWLAHCAKLDVTNPLHRVRGRFVAFALLGAIYGPLQFWRIVTQAHLPGVLDQWFTLPFFGAFCAWALQIVRPAKHPARRMAAIMTLSIASYALALVDANGFVIALAVHIVSALALGLMLLARAPSKLAAPFVGALVCCAAFVGFKEADFALATFAPFQRFTGHFWSKLGDAGQVHFALALFAAVHRALPEAG